MATPIHGELASIRVDYLDRHGETQHVWVQSTEILGIDATFLGVFSKLDRQVLQVQKLETIEHNLYGGESSNDGPALHGGGEGKGKVTSLAQFKRRAAV